MAGIKISLLREGDLEELRLIRNSAEVKKFLNFQSEITAEDQRRWHAGLAAKGELCYLYRSGSRVVGYAQVRPVSETIFELGSVVSDPALWSTPTPFVLSSAIILTEIDSARWTDLQTQVRSDNPRAMNFSVKQGCHLVSTSEVHPHHDYRVHRYQINLERWRVLNASRLRRYGASIASSLEGLRGD